MKKVVTRLFVIVAVTALVAVLTGGCTKKPVVPPESDSQASSSTSTGSYPTAEGTYSENNLAIEGTLDDSSSTGDVAAAMDQQSDEYKQMQKDGLSEDETKTAEDHIQKLTDEFTEKVEKIVEAKEEDIMTI